MLIPFRKKNIFRICNSIIYLNRELRIQNSPLSLSFEKNELKLFKNDFPQRYDTRQDYPYVYNKYIPEQENTNLDCKMHNKIILRIYCTVLSSVLSGSKLLLTFKQNNICSNGSY